MAFAAMPGTEHEIGATIDRFACLRIGSEALAIDIQALKQTEPAADVVGEAQRVRRHIATHSR